MCVPASYNPEDGDGNVTIPGRVVLGENIWQFTISEEVVYYSTTDNKIYRMSLDGNDLGFVAEGYGPAVIGNYLFYIDSDGKMNCLSAS